jgi:uncharacterized protein (DUF952 family)
VALVFKVLSAAEWDEAQRAGVFSGSEVDLRDGFIHLSDVDQVEKTVSLWFAERDDLVLAAVEAAGLAEALKWEPSRGGALFPHLYAPLKLSQVAWAKPFSSRQPEALRTLISGAK